MTPKERIFAAARRFSGTRVRSTWAWHFGKRPNHRFSGGEQGVAYYQKIERSDAVRLPKHSM